MLTMLAFTLVAPAWGHAATLTVCASGCDYTTIAAAISAASASDTISIKDTVHNEAHITVHKNLTIQGLGAASTAVDGAGSGPIFTINEGVTATIQDMTIRNAGGFNFYGGAIFNSGTTILSNSALSSNSVLNAGGGIYNEATITIRNSRLSGNSASGGSGGAIFNKGKVTISYSTLSDNAGQFYGGGIDNEGGTATISNSTISGNTSSYRGGGLANFSSDAGMTITNSTVSGNSAPLYGGGIYDEGTTTIISSTISDNTSKSSQGGGLAHFLYSNITVKNSIVGDNTGGDCFFDFGSSITALGASLGTDASCGSVNFTKVTLAQLNLGPLALNAPGTTKTHALLPGSVAIDAVTECTDIAGKPLVTDQRGAPRPDFGELVCDIGAYESQETFAGEPGAPNCHGKSVSALAKRYRGLPAAASALKFPSVKALQAAIRAYCRD